MSPNCTLPPEGWHCSRAPGHDGPCAARPSMTDAQNSGAVELLPCPNPWCEADERNGDFRPQVQYSNFGMVYVACTSCTMAGPTRQHEVDAITAWNTRSTPAPSDQAGWQDIASAPRDGTWFLGYWLVATWEDRIQPTSWSSWHGSDDPCFVTNGDSIDWCQPTHWMPLPTAPTLTAGEGGGDGTR